MTAAPIIQRIEIPPTPGENGRAVTTQARPDREYVASTDRSYWRHQMRIVPHYIDDLTADLGDDLYDRMTVDSQIYACLNIFKSAIIEEGVTLHPTVARPDQPGYKKAQRILAFCKDNLEWLSTPLDNVLWNLLDAMAYGNKVAELVYVVDDGQLWLDAIKVKPRKAVAFVTDAFSRVLGLVALTSGIGSAVRPGTLDLSPDAQRDVLLPREKFVVYSFRTRDDDPRGTSLLRAAYTPWWAKQQMWPEYMKFLAQFATPSLAGTTPENAYGGNDLDENGEEIAGTWKSAEDRMLAALLGFKNGTAAVFPHGSEVKPIAVDYGSGGHAFETGFAMFDRQITKAILHQTLATEESRFQARAAASVHQDTMGMVLRQAKKSLRTTVRTDILWKLVAYNFGTDAAWRFTPHVSLGEVDPQDVTDLMTAIAALQRVGYLAPDQLSQIDVRLGIPQRSGDAAAAVTPQAGSPASQSDASDETEDDDGE